MTLLARLRRWWLDVHLWIGAGLLLVLAPLGVSGSYLVWHDAIDRALHAERYAVSGPQAALPAEAYAERAQQAFAGRATLSQLRLPATPGDPVVAVGRIGGPGGPGGRPRQLNAWIDPPTGRVLAIAEPARGFSMWTHRLHGTLLIPQVGRKLVGWLGWAMFVSCATGLWLWWPRHGGFVSGLRWRRGASQLFNLHHMVGFWLCLPLAVLSLTGVYISFPQTSRALFGVQAPAAAPGGGRGAGRFAPPLPRPQLSVAQAVVAAAALAPGRTLASLSTPTRGNAPAWRVEFSGPAGPLSVRVLDATGEAKAARGAQPGGEGGPDPFSRTVRRIHDGTDTGYIWRMAIAVAGLAPLVLGASGLIMWLRRRSRRRAVRHAA